MKKPHTFKNGAAVASLITAAIIIAPAATSFGQAFWTGGTSDYNVAGSWNPTGVPSGNAANDSGLNNVVLIQPGDPVWGHGDTLAGQGSGASGAYLQTGSTNNTGYPNGGNWMRLGIGGGGTVGYYTLSNGVVNVAGQTHLGENGTGTLEVDGGTYNTGYNGNPGICAGDGDFGASTGTLILTGGTINNINNETWFGENNSACTGYLIMSGGNLITHNWFVFGRNGGNGFGTMTAGMISETSGGNFLVGGGGTGQLTQSGGTINVLGGPGFLCPQSGPGTGTYNLSGTGVLNAGSWLTIGRGGVGTLNMSGGMIVKSDPGNNDHFDVGAGGSSSGTGPGTITQTGGIITNTTSDFWMGEVANATWTMSNCSNYLANLIICQGGGIRSTVSINGGFMSVAAINSAQPSSSFSTLNLNGGTIQTSGPSSSFVNNISVADIQSGGVTFDTQGYAVTIPEALTDGGGGTLTKIGSGTLTLSGANSYAGATVVNNGVLSTTTESTGGGSYATADGTTLDVAVTTSGSFLPAANLTLGSASGATLEIDLGSTGNPATAPIAVSGALTPNGTVTVNVTDAIPAVGKYPLISYSSLGVGGTFVLGTLPPGAVGTLVNDTASNSIDLNVTSAGAPYWNGNVAGGAWDIGSTINWLDLATASPEVYHDGELVLFNDNATGTTTVSINASVKPGGVTVNNTLLPYTFTGSGSIGGATGLTKEGTNSLTIANSTGNSFTGPVTVGGGILSVASLANGGLASTIGASSASPTNLVLAGGTLSYTGPATAINRGYSGDDTNSAIDIDTEANLSLGGSVTAGLGSGFTKGGPAQLTYTGAGTNILSDSLGYAVAQGTVLFSGSGSGQTNDIIGNLDVGNAGSTNATLAVTNNSTVNMLTGGLVDVGDGGGAAASGTISVVGGTLNAGTGQIWVGQGANGVGAMNLTGGAFYADNWLAIGRANGTGTLNISSNAVLVESGGGGNLDIGTSAGMGGIAGTGTLNQTGGAITNTASQTWLGEGTGDQPASGTWNMSGGTAVLGELHIGVGGTGTSALNISGSASIVESYLLLANYDGNTTGNVNVGSVSQPGGTVTVNADMNVGGQGTGTLNFVTNGGGKLTVTGTLYLSRSSQTADGTVNLNAGGTLVAGYINNGWGFQNNYPTPTNNPNAFNFNGGTLQAYVGSPYFIQPYVNAVVQAGGAIIDDGGYAVTVLAPLVDGGGGGGLTKLGSGSLFLNGVNTYTGATLVNAGVLGIGPAGSIAGPVTVNTGGILVGDTGTIQTSYINNTLTLNAGSTTAMELTPASNDEIEGLTGVAYGGALVLTNTSATQLTVGAVYKLFNCAVAGTGNFSSVTILPSGAGTFSPSSGTLTIISTAPPVVNAPSFLNGNIVITGSGGNANSGYTLLSTTNIATPLANWVTNTTGTFSGSGTFSNAIPATTNTPAVFFQLRTP